MANQHTRRPQAPASAPAARPDVLTRVAPAKEPTRTKTGRIAPIVQETIVDMKPKTDPRTGKPEVPGQASTKARHQTPDNPTMRVRALRQLYYQLKRRREGDVFTLAKVEDFNAKIHQWVDESTPERLTTSRQTLLKHHEEVRAARASSPHDPSTPQPPGEDDDVLN